MFSSPPRYARATSPQRPCRSSAATPADDRSRPGLAAAFALMALLAPLAGNSAGDPAAVDRLLAAMTLQEKIALIHGATESASSYQGQAGYLPGVARLGIASLRL